MIAFESKASRSKTYDPPKPEYPTSARPGTEEKILVMADRFERGFALHHPLDAETIYHAQRFDPNEQPVHQPDDPFTLPTEDEVARDAEEEAAPHRHGRRKEPEE